MSHATITFERGRFVQDCLIDLGKLIDDGWFMFALDSGKLTLSVSYEFPTSRTGGLDSADLYACARYDRLNYALSKRDFKAVAMEPGSFAPSHLYVHPEFNLAARTCWTAADNGNGHKMTCIIVPEGSPL